MIEDNKWDYKPSTMTNDASPHGSNAITRSVPPFSEDAFLEYLVRFIVADDQVRFTNLVFLHALTHLSSRFALLNAPNSGTYVWCSGKPSQTAISLVAIRWGRLFSISGGSHLSAQNLSFLCVGILSSYYIN